MGDLVEIDFGVYNTRRNLPARSGRRRGEANFLGAFLRRLAQTSTDTRLFGRQFHVPECGVADCITLADQTSSRSAHLVAFEAKLSDWRRALSQAYRYRYYADLAVVVLPASASRPAVENRRNFEDAGVALWTFDPRVGEIVTRIEAKPTSPLSPKKKMQALRLLERCSLHLRKL